MNYWKAGCKWGVGAPDFYDFVKKEQVVFCAKEITPTIGDRIAICQGFDIKAVAEVVSELEPVTSPKYARLKNSVQQYDIAYEKWNLVADVKILKEFTEGEEIRYPIQKGLSRINKPELIEQLKNY